MNVVLGVVDLEYKFTKEPIQEIYLNTNVNTKFYVNSCLK